jgi:hypothetical protein
VTDTPDHIAKLQRDMLMRRSPAERLAMGCAMFDVARRLMRASLGDPHGTDNSPEMKVQLFLRTYGSDFDDETRARIVAWLLGSQRR